MQLPSQYAIDYEYLARLSEERNMSCIGATNYGSRQITVSSAGAPSTSLVTFSMSWWASRLRRKAFIRRSSEPQQPCSVRMRLPTSGSILLTASCTGSLTVITAKKWRRFAAPHQKHTHIFWHWKVKIGSRLHRPSCLAAAVWNPTILLLYCTVACIVNQINGNPSKIRWMHSLHYGYFVQFADCKPIENLLFYKHSLQIKSQG